MDFGTLLHTAQKNEKTGKKEGVRCYSTKFEPPRKEQRNKQQLSENIKKFLAKKEAEEKEKKLEAQRKKDELLALRAKDKKATRRVNVMLKRTKSANQSVIQDAVDTNNTSITLAGPIQPDEDDYGYVSQEAAAFYNKMMEKYSKIPEEPKFNLNKKKKVSTDLNSTKERVKAALEREREEASLPHKRKRKNKDEYIEVDSHTDEPPKLKSKSAAPPPMNFNDLLKLAEKKQFEPIVIEPKPKEEKLLTKKQKKELEREKEWRDRKDSKLPTLENKRILQNKIPKLSSDKIGKVDSDLKTSKLNGSFNEKKSVAEKTSTLQKSQVSKAEVENCKNLSLSKTPNFPDKKTNHEIVPLHSAKPSSSSKVNGMNKSKDLTYLKRKELTKLNTDPQHKKFALSDVKQCTPKDPKPKQLQLIDSKTKQLSAFDSKPKHFPPSDIKKREVPLKDVRKKPLASKRRIIHDDDEEYDSEMDDFIDDGPEDYEDYSKYISEIFGYDKSKYRHVDDDIDNMESTFAQQMREEVISTKIGIMEDLEDMRKEEEEKRRKAVMKKKKIHS